MSALDTQEGGDHYKHMVIQPAEFNQKNRIPFLESNVIKRMCRHRSKNELEDLRKAIHEICLVAEMEYGVPDLLSAMSHEGEDVVNLEQELGTRPRGFGRFSGE